MALLYPTRRQMLHTGPTLNFDELSCVSRQVGKLQGVKVKIPNYVFLKSQPIMRLQRRQ